MNTGEYNIIKLPRPKLGEVLLSSAVSMRRSCRDGYGNSISLQDLSNILWCANGTNAIGEDGRLWRTVPSARNQQEIDLYVISEDGVYSYDYERNRLIEVIDKDIRTKVAKQEFVGKSSYIICLVANYAKMKSYKWWQFIKRYRYACIDTGYVSQNIYLYCAAYKLRTVAVGMIKKKRIKRYLHLKYAQPMLCMPIG